MGEILYRYMKLDDEWNNFEKVLFENKIYYPTKKQLNDIFEFNSKHINLMPSRNSSDIENVILLGRSLGHNLKGLKPEHLTSIDGPLYLLLKNVFIDGLESNATTARILCFSKKWNNEPMWTHYAQSHEGVVVGIDVGNEIIASSEYQTAYKYFGYRIDVDYIESRTFDYSLGQNKFEHPINMYFYLLLKKSFNLKNKDWSYEEEVRFFKSGSELAIEELRKKSNIKIENTDLINKDGYVEFPSEFIRKIIFGYNVRKEKIDEIRTKLQKLGRHDIAIYQIDTDFKNAQLTYRQINYT